MQQIEDKLLEARDDFLYKTGAHPTHVWLGIKQMEELQSFNEKHIMELKIIPVDLESHFSVGIRCGHCGLRADPDTARINNVYALTDKGTMGFEKEITCKQCFSTEYWRQEARWKVDSKDKGF